MTSEPRAVPADEDVIDAPVRWKGRHTVLGVLFVTSIISSMDRAVMSSTIPYIAKDFSLTSTQSGILLSAFFLSYSISQIPGGLLADKFGVRRVTTLAMLWWSAFAALTGAAANLAHMLVTRFLFGLGEGVFPASAFKTVAVWFPPRERATANAVKLASTPLGAALAPLFVILVMSLGSWRTVFYALFLPGLLLSLLFWLVVADRPSESPRVSAAELAEIESPEAATSRISTPRPSFLEAFKRPYIFRYFLILFLFDVGYWGFTSWLPTYLVKERGFSIVGMGVAASLPAFAGTAGCLAGGLVSDRFFSDRRRLPIITTQVLAALLLYLTYVSGSVAVLVIAQTLAGFCLSFFTSAFWALPMTTVPKSLMGVVSGAINMAAQVAAFMSPIAVGYLVDRAGGSFATTFVLLIGSILLSCAVVFTLPGRLAVRTMVSASQSGETRG